jgi:hypothetical protein
MAKTPALPYRIAIRDTGNAQNITKWLDEHLAQDDWQVEFMGVEEFDDQNRRIRYVIRFRNREDLQRFKSAWSKPEDDKPEAAPGLRKLRGFAAFFYVLGHFGEEVYVRRK